MARTRILTANILPTNVEWDKDNLYKKLSEWPIGEPINWTQTADEFHIKGSNRGQIVKEFAIENDIDVTELDKRPMKNRLRARKLKLPGVGISVPTHPTATEIKKEWQNMLRNGQLTLGEPCHPQTITKMLIMDGEVKKTENVVYGRKIPLMEIRKKLLAKHEDLMHLHSDEEIDKLNNEELQQLLVSKRITVPIDSTENQLKELIKRIERTRTIACWHDHSTILGKGYVLVTTKVVYDPAVFKAQQDMNTQAFIEEPEIHIIAMSSSSIEDQAALIEDRLDCIREMKLPLETKKNIKINDKLTFFMGDKPAVQFERGTQMGGYFPCGSCGSHASRFTDFAHCSNAEVRSLADLQALATGGKILQCIYYLPP